MSSLQLAPLAHTRVQQRHQADDTSRLTCEPTSFLNSVDWKSRKLPPGAQRSDGYPLYRDTAGRAIDGLALAERERQRLHELGLSILQRVGNF